MITFSRKVFVSTRIFRQHSLKPLPAFYIVNDLESLFSKLKDPVPRNMKRSLYKLERKDCEIIYIGRTGRNLHERVIEHETAFNTNEPVKFNFAAYLLRERYSFDKNKNVYLSHMGRREDSLH